MRERERINLVIGRARHARESLRRGLVIGKGKAPEIDGLRELSADAKAEGERVWERLVM